MKRRGFLLSTAALVVAAAVTTPLATSRNRAPAGLHTFHHENVLGTSLELRIAAGTDEEAARAEAAALAEIDRLSKVLSAWDPGSEFSRWTRTRGVAVPVSDELFEVLGLFGKWRRDSLGAINAAAATGNQLWKTAEREGRLPSEAERTAAARQMQAEHWTLDAAGHTATHLDDAPLALASFAKSYVAAKAADAALAEAEGGVVVNIGGDIVVRGGLTESVDIRDPRSDAENDPALARVTVRDGAIATSGNYRRGVEIAGRHYSHIIDPRTGGTAEDVLSATVQAADPATAGALATAVSVLSEDETKRVLSRYPGVQYLIARRDGSTMVSDAWRSAAFALAPAPMQAGAGDWNGGFELDINLTIARADSPRYRRPYVAVWVEDKDKFPVRTVALWYEKPRWLPDLRVWYRDDRMRALAEGNEIANSVSSATRPPGRYTLKWDGKDNKGHYVKSGRYTVCIEAAREHGTYGIMRQDMDFTGTPKQVQVAGNTEIESATLDYRKAGR